MNINGTSSLTSKFRLSGLATGLDTDQMVKDLMKAERMPYDNLSRKKQLAEWKRDAYRDVTTLLRGFKSEYMDLLRPATNMLSQDSYKKYSVLSIDSSSGTSSTAVSATAVSTAAPGSHTVVVNNIATADIAESMAGFTGSALTFSPPLDLSGKQFTLSIDGGGPATVTFGASASYSNIEELSAALQTLIDNEVGSGRVGVSFDSYNQLHINTAGGTKTLQLNEISALSTLGITAGAQTYNGVTKQLVSSAAITSAGTEAADIQAMKGKQFLLNVDGSTRTITIGDYSSMAQLVQGLQDSINTAFGNGKVNVSIKDSYKIQFSNGINGVNSISINSGSGTSDGLRLLKMNSGDSNRLNTSLSLQELSDKFSTPLTFSGESTNVTSTANITETSWIGKKFNLTVDGNTREIAISIEPSNLNQLAVILQDAINKEFGAGAVEVTNSPAGRLTFTKGASTGYVTLTSAYSNDALSAMKIASGTSTAGQLKFSINSKDFIFSATQSLSSMLNTVNTDSIANVKIYYDSSTDKFRITASRTGAGDNITISETGGNFFSGASGIDHANSVTSQGVDANAVIDGQIMVRSSNTFSLNGINYSLLAAKPGILQNITLKLDTNSVYDNITKFVTKYNEIIDNLNKKLSEESGKDYQPLTDEEKAGMNADDIKKWEDKAKSGLLRNDQILQSIVYSMRNSLSDAVKDEGQSLSGIGITTGSYEEKGKLYIDEAKLKSAIEQNPDGIMNLFGKKSSTYSTYSRTMTSSQRYVRYGEEGLIQRLSDIIDDNTSIFRDANGNKGFLLEKAGMVGDSSNIKNMFYDQITEYNKQMNELSHKLIDKENGYYQKFANLEKMISQMNNQSSWLASQLGQSGQ